MSVLLDSADLNDLKNVAEYGLLRGVTTNPTLMRAVTDDPLAQAREILRMPQVETLYYQPSGRYGSHAGEAASVLALAPERVVIKLPVTPQGVALASTLVADGARVSLTAAQSSAAMVVAETLGAHSVIPYVDRALRDVRTENGLVRGLVEQRRGSTLVVAASVKNLGQLLVARAEGADAVSVPASVIEDLVAHPASAEAEAAFEREYATQRT